VHRITLERDVTMPNSTSSVSREIATLRRTLKAMDRSLRRLAPKLQAVGNGRENGKAGRPSRTLKLSPKRRAQLKLQGQYIGYVRQFSLKYRAMVRSFLAKKDMRAAVARAKQLMLKKVA
jgi:hypothetical protein